MSLLPKSIHRCRPYPTKFNSGRDIPASGLEFVCVFGQDGLLELATEWFSNDYWPLYATYGHQNTPRIRRDCASLILVDDSGQVLIFLSNLRTVPRARLSC